MKPLNSILIISSSIIIVTVITTSSDCWNNNYNKLLHLHNSSYVADFVVMASHGIFQLTLETTYEVYTVVIPTINKTRNIEAWGIISQDHQLRVVGLDLFTCNLSPELMLLNIYHWNIIITYIYTNLHWVRNSV